MPTCHACNALNGRPSSMEPHAALDLVDASEWKAGGMAKGTIEMYKCKTCGISLSRDLDKKDRHALWEIHKAG